MQIFFAAAKNFQFARPPEAITTFYEILSYNKESTDLRNAISSACEYTGLKPIYADEKTIDGHILDQKILPLINDCLFCLFEISNKNRPNVFLEYGYAKAKDKPCYLLIREGIKPPSDLEGYDRIQYGNFEELKKRLSKVLVGLAKIYFSEETIHMEILSEEPKGVRRVKNLLTNEIYHFLDAGNGNLWLHPGFPIRGRAIDFEAARAMLRFQDGAHNYKKKTGKDIFEDIPRPSDEIEKAIKKPRIAIPYLPPVPGHHSDIEAPPGTPPELWKVKKGRRK